MNNEVMNFAVAVLAKVVEKVGSTDDEATILVAEVNDAINECLEEYQD